MSGVGAGRAVRGGGGADSALAGGDSEALPVDGASRYGLSSPTESGLCGDRVRPRRLGRLRSVIRKLRVIRWLSSGRTERRCMASEAMSQERRIGKPTRKARARAKRRRNKDGKGEVPSHSSKDEIRLSVPLEECAKRFARPITRRGSYPGQTPGTPLARDARPACKPSRSLPLEYYDPNRSAQPASARRCKPATLRRS